MAADGAFNVVIFSVNVIGNRARQGDNLRPRRGRQKPSARHRDQQNLAKGNSRLAHNRAVLGVKVQDAVKAANIHQRSAVVQAGVAITAPQSIGQQWSVLAQQFAADIFHPRRSQNFAVRGLWIVSPALVAGVARAHRQSGCSVARNRVTGFRFYLGRHLYDYRQRKVIRMHSTQARPTM